MNSRLPAAFISLLGSAFALTDDDLAPAALAGKTLTFTIESGTAPLAVSGVWTGTFESSPANGFTVTKVSGATANSSGTRTYVGYVGGHAYTIDPFITGQGPSTLTLWISEGRPRYYIDLDSTGNTTQFGGFTIGGATVKAPEISVNGPDGDPLEDNTGKTRFGTVKPGQTGTARKFTIKNTGKAKLTGLSVSKTGKDFIITGSVAPSLAPGKSTSFKVSFKPSSAGTKNAVIKIDSNDADEAPFEIKVIGVGAR
ncbi:MAG: choice-of-anchor D domain-containing protein [Verrucomicrobiota bacterium]